MHENQQSKALVPVTHSFEMEKAAPAMEITPELAAELTKEDMLGYVPVPPALAYVDIRQKAVLDAAGQPTRLAGNFRIRDKSMKYEMSDASSQIGLPVTIISDKLTKVYFKQADDACFPGKDDV